MANNSAQTNGKTVTVPRKRLRAALDRVKPIVATRTCKPILNCVRLEASGGALKISASDGELSLATTIEAEGELPVCVVPYAELSRRIQASKTDNCSLTLENRGRKLLLSGGNVTHALFTQDPEVYPPARTEIEGEAITLDALEFRKGLVAIEPAVAREPSRYAINGALFESVDTGTRLVATDGRRMVVVELCHAPNGYRGNVILPARFMSLVRRLIDKKGDAPLELWIKPNVDKNKNRQPADLSLVGPDWRLSSTEVEGDFPYYRDVIPHSASKFVVNRVELIETLREVALATSLESIGVATELRPRSIRLSADSPELGRSTGSVRATFTGGGDSTIHAGFNCTYLLAALQTLNGERVVIDVGQNGCGSDGKVFGKPALLYVEHDGSIRWIVMPLNMGYPATRKYLGCNFRDEKEEAA